MSRIQQDQFVDDEEDECCPLCVEEFDLSDKNFRPCPCGYQVRCFKNAVKPLTSCLLTMSIIDMSVLLQQHQDDDERPVPGVSTAL